MAGDFTKEITVTMVKSKKKKYTGIFRDGGAGRQAIRRFRERRKKLMKKEAKLMVITGVPHGPGQETSWSYAYTPTYQEPAIMYLTGINQSNVILLLDPGSKESDEILFINPKNPAQEFWDGLRFGVGNEKSVREARRVTGIKDIRSIKDFQKTLRERFFRKKQKRLGALWMEGTKKKKKVVIKDDHNWNFKKKLTGMLGEWKAPRSALCNIMKSHFDLRLPLDKYDVANTLKAQQITGKAFEETLRCFHQFKNETHVQGFIEGRMIMRSPYGLSFPSIVASGFNATTLHYVKNDDEFDKGELVLIDFGVRWMTMHADISRAVPSSGSFNPLQRILYEIVLDAQLRVEKKASVGIKINELNDLCWDSINHDLDKKFKAAGGKYKLKYEKRPHGVSHLIGEQEHDGDPFRNYANDPMKAGWMISNEPGLYGFFRFKHKGKTYDEEIGIRIEDNLLITGKGCQNLSKGIPKTVEAIEGLMRGGRNVAAVAL